MRAPVHVAGDAAALSAYRDLGLTSTFTATFYTGSPTVDAATGVMSRATTTRSVTGVLVKMVAETIRALLSRGLLEGGAPVADALFWTDRVSAPAYDTATRLVDGADTYEVIAVEETPALDGTIVLALRRRE